MGNSGTLRGRPDKNAVLRKCTRFASFWLTIHTDPENAVPENTRCWKRVSGWRNPKTQPSHFHVDGESAFFPKRWRHRHRPTPRPLASDLWTLRRLTTTMAADNMLVLILQQILSLLGLLRQNITLLCHYVEQKRILDNRIRHIILDPPRKVTRRATRRRFWVRPGETSS